MTSLSSEIHSDRKTRNHDIMCHLNFCFYPILKSSVIYFEQTHDKMETVFVKSTIEMTSNVQKSSQNHESQESRVLLQRSEHFDVISMTDKSMDHGK